MTVPRRGMLGPNGPDEFPKFDGWQPPAKRSQIDDFDLNDAKSLLDGDVTPEESQQIAAQVRAGVPGAKPHGGHRLGTGWGKDEFPAGWAEPDLIEWIRAITDNPSRGHATETGFAIYGSHRGISGVLYVRPIGFRGGWYVATAFPTTVAE